MCGLTGFTGFNKADPTKMRMLFLDNQERGSHSSGIFGDGRLMRKATPAKEFIKDPNFNSIANSNLVIGHTRFSTGSARTKENAHPFVFDLGMDPKYGRQYIAGTHNGWVVNEYEMENLVSGFQRADVDSASIYKLMSFIESMPKKEKDAALKSLGIASPELVFTKFEGAMALAFIYKGCLHLYRRNSRPLFVGKAKEGVYYSSIKDSLINIGIDSDHIWGVKEDSLIKFHGSRIAEITKIDKPRLSISEYTTTSSWDSGVNNKLVEELTGKKHTPAAARDTKGTYTTGTGAQMKITTNYRSEEEYGTKKHGTQNQLILSQEDIRKSQGRTIYGRNTLIPSSIDDEFVLNDFLKSEITNSSTRRVFVESIDYLKRYKNVWPSVYSNDSAFSIPLYSCIAPSSIKDLKDKNASFLSLKIRGYKDSVGEMYYDRDDMYISLSIGAESLRKDRINVFEKVEKSTYSIYLSPEFLGDGTIFDVDISIIFARIPGLTFTSSYRIYPGSPASIRSYIDVDKIVEYQKSMFISDSDGSGKEVYIPKFLPLGNFSVNVLKEAVRIYQMSVLGSEGYDYSKAELSSPTSAYYHWSKANGNKEIHMPAIVVGREPTVKESILTNLEKLKDELTTLTHELHKNNSYLKKKNEEWNNDYIAENIKSSEFALIGIQESLKSVSSEINNLKECVIIPVERENVNEMTT